LMYLAGSLLLKPYRGCVKRRARNQLTAAMVAVFVVHTQAE